MDYYAQYTALQKLHEAGVTHITVPLWLFDQALSCANNEDALFDSTSEVGVTLQEALDKLL